MALASYSGVNSYTQSAGEFLDLSNELAEIIRRDNTAFISRVGIAGEATEVTHSWIEDKLNANIVTDSGSGINNSATSWTLVAGNGALVLIGSLLMDTVAGQSEVMQVTAISTDTLTIVRGYGGTTAVSHAANFTARIIANPAQEGQDPPADSSRLRTKVSNYTQIFQRGINVSQTMRSILQAGVADEFTFQVARRMLEIMRELDSSVILGVSPASGQVGSSTVYRSMTGLLSYASQAGGNTNSTSESLTPSVINAMVLQIWTSGGQPNFVLVGGKQKQKISAFDQSYRRTDIATTSVGYVVDRFLSDLGFSLEIIVDPWMPDDVCVVGDINKVRVMPLRNDAMRAEELAKTGRSWKAQVTGQYTCEVRNAKEAFAYHNNLQ